METFIVFETTEAIRQIFTNFYNLPLFEGMTQKLQDKWMPAHMELK